MGHLVSRPALTSCFRALSDEATVRAPLVPLAREKETKIGHHDCSRDHLQEVRSATRLLLKIHHLHLPTHSPAQTYLRSPTFVSTPRPSPMPLVRSQGDEFRRIRSDIDTTSIERWRVSTSYSQRSSDLRSSLKSESWNPRFPSKTASWTTAAHRVVRLERVQEDEEGDDYLAYQPGPPQIPMETNVSDLLYVYSPVLLYTFQDQIDDASTSAYTCPAWPSADGLDQAHPMILNSPTHDLANPFPSAFEDSEASYVSLCPRRS